MLLILLYGILRKMKKKKEPFFERGSNIYAIHKDLFYKWNSSFSLIVYITKLLLLLLLLL